MPSISSLAANAKCLASVHKHSERPRNIMLSMRPPRITDEMYARIPALLEQGMCKAEIAAMYGVTLGTLAVFCSQRGISLRKGGPRKRSWCCRVNRYHSATTY